MLFITAIYLFTFVWALCSLSVEASTESAASLLKASSTSLHPTSHESTLVVRLRSDDHGEGQPPSEQLNSPIQVCPTDPPIYCFMPTCLGSPDPPNAFRCKSRSITIRDSVETTLFGCQCCPLFDSSFYCDDELCKGDEEMARCASELLKGCHCLRRNPATPVLSFSGDICVDPISPVLRLIQERSTTPTEPPPSSSEFWNVTDKGYGDTKAHSMPQKDVGNEVLPRTTLEVWLDSYDLGSNMGLNMVKMLR
jgi:hypothetical protein